MEYVVTILPAIITIALIFVLGYLTQTSLKEKYFKPLEKRVKELENELDQKTVVIKKLNGNMIDLQMELERMADDLIEVLKKQPATTPPPAPKEDLVKDFYMSTPNKDGSFNIASKSDSFKPSVSLYHFMPLNALQAEFRFESDEQGQRDALNFSKAYIEPVCEELNDVTPESKRIITVTKGLAELTEGQWKVTKKAQIKYE